MQFSTDEEVTRVDRLSEEMGTIQSLGGAFERMLHVILVALDSPAVFMRTKALRALGQIVTSDPGTLRHVGDFPLDSHLPDSVPAGKGSNRH